MVPYIVINVRHKVVLTAVKVRIYPSKEQQSHLVQAWLLCSLGMESVVAYHVPNLQRDSERALCFHDEKTDRASGRLSMNGSKSVTQACLQSSVLNLSQAFINFFDGRTAYPTLKKRHGKQSIEFPQNVKVLSDNKIKFPGNLGESSRLKFIVNGWVAWELLRCPKHLMVDTSPPC